MPAISEIKHKREAILQVASSYGATNIRVFGSVARGEDKQNSDIDLLINLEEGRSLFDLIDLKNKLEEILDRKVGVVTEESVHWYLKDKIKEEAIEI
ncbi:MAG: nucleotidyltransferase family protein [Peptococcaceae bacterium]